MNTTKQDQAVQNNVIPLPKSKAISPKLLAYIEWTKETKFFANMRLNTSECSILEFKRK